MIPTKEPLLHTPAWQQELARAVTCRRELLRRLGLSAEDAECSAEQEFPLRVPEGFISRMEPGNPRDPLLLQVLPQRREQLSPPGYHTDPVGDGDALAAPGLIHKYRGRVLLVASRTCALHCRFCFRRHFPYREAIPHPDRWGSALEYIAANPTISEVILSGGDPLTLSDGRLARLAAGLEPIPHLRRIRIHTRLPVVLPSRVNDALLDWLGQTRLQPVVVIHANHPNEIDGEVGHALRRLAAAGIMLLN
ncbi:MAG TPA: KamA family radical SAM protein, partial [Gammaproteobacteria bacterium]|nr:KamA family radical SAM protein [Gammaproteobacteria bacterium]